MPPTTAPPVNKTEEVRKIVRRLGHDAETSEVRQALAAIKITVDDTIIRTVKREIREEVEGNKAGRNGQQAKPGPTAKAEPKNDKPSKKKEQPLGAGKEALFKMFKEQGTQIDYAAAHRQLNGQGLQVGAEWFRRLKQEYIAQNPETPNVATQAGLAAVAADSEAPAKEVRSNGAMPEAGAVMGGAAARSDQIPLREDQIPAPAKPSAVEMVRAGRKFIEMMGSKEEALALITEL